MLASVIPSWVAAIVRSRWVTASRAALAPPAPLVDELLDAGLADRDEGELGGHEEGVQGDQRGHGEQAGDRPSPVDIDRAGSEAEHRSLPRA